jgi:excisionase family DNA binding protein
MNDTVVQLYNEYLSLVGDPGGAASLVLADALTAKSETPDRSYTVKDAAGRLSLSSKKVYLMCLDGQLRSFRAGRAIRIPIEEIERLEASASIKSTLLISHENRHGVL